MAGKGDKKHNSKKGEKKASKKIATEVEDFPRGGASGLTPLEYREVSRQAEREVLFSDGVLASDVADKKKQKKHKRRSSEDGGSVEKKKKKTKKPQPTEDVETETLDQIIDRAAPVESLSYKRLTKGALVLGCVSAVRGLELTVDLPGAMTGHVPITAVSPELTQMAEKMAQGDDSDDEEDGLDLGSRFYVGQYVKCVVAEISQTDASGKAKTRVELSLMPGDVNERIDVDDICEGLVMTASVKSVEDRGYVLNTGLATSKMAAFLPTKEARKWLERWMPAQGELKVGQVIEACVAKITDGRRSLQMTLDPESVAEALPKDTFKTMASVQPGQLVSATVMKVWDRGLSLRFMGFYDCSADLVSIGLAGALDKSEIAQTYDLGKVVKARVVYVSLTTASKTILVSLLPHIVEMSPRPGITGYETPAAAQLVTGSATGAGTGKFSTMDVRSKWPIPYGTVLEEVAVVGVNPHIGLTLAVPGVETVRCLARKGDLVDNKDLIPALSRTAGVFQLGSVHRARVLGYEAMSGLVHVSLKPSVVDEPLFRIEDVVPGAVITGTVRRLKDSRLVVALSGRLTGTVAGDQLSDTHLKHPELVFKADHPVACRVLSVHAKKNDIKLTCRKSLVQSKLPVVTGFSAERGAVPGVITHATVVHHTKAGVLVSFYQGAAGMIPMADISANTKGAGKIPKQLEVGRVVKCRIVQVKPKQRRITASLN
ncbi:rRNA biogenesis protein rrp5, partial [Linderina pennispora]